MRFLALFLVPYLFLAKPKPPIKVLELLEAIQTPSKPDWLSIEAKVDIQVLLQVMNDALLDSYCTGLEDGEPIELLKAKWRWVDLNKDKELDLIFLGTCQPYLQTEIFLSDKGRFKNALSVAGSITKLSLEGDSTEIHVQREACCCDYYNTLSVFKIAAQSLEIIEELDVHWHGEMEIEKPIFQRNLRTSQTISIRSTPEKDDQIGHWECSSDRKVMGNVVAEFEKGTEIVALSSRRYKGRDWYFVVVLPNHTRILDDFENQPDVPGKTVSLGWVTGTELNLD